MTLKVALIQKSAVPNDRKKHEAGISYLEKAKELGADLLFSRKCGLPAMQNHFLMH